MDEKAFKARCARLEQIGNVIAKLPPEIRGAAFALLEAWASELPSDPEGGGSGKKSRGGTKSPGDTTAPQDKESFFKKFDHDKPADNAKLIAAYFYAHRGSEPFSLDDARSMADEVGITVPGRLDMTYVQAKEKGKKLFARAGKGSFKPTVHGEAYLKATYSVKKGTKPA